MSQLNDTLLIAAGLDIYVPPVYVDSTFLQTSNISTGMSVPAPAGMVAGDLITAVAWRFTSPGTWSASGFAKEDELLAAYGVALFKKTATGSEPSNYTFTHSNGSGNGLVFIVAHRGATTIIANNLSGMSLASADPQIASSMSVTKDRVLVAVLGLNNAAVTLTSGPSGMTQREAVFSSSPRGALYDLVNPSTGASGTKSFDISSAAGGGAFLYEIQ